MTLDDDAELFDSTPATFADDVKSECGSISNAVAQIRAKAAEASSKADRCDGLGVPAHVLRSVSARFVELADWMESNLAD